MARRDPTVSLRQMFDYASKAGRLAQGKRREEIEQDEILLLALTRLLEILGEAASRVPADVRSRHAKIPWSSIVGLRNVLIHGYDHLDMDILWRVLSTDVPELIPRLQEMVKTETP